jgi:hypothetical protein
MIGELTAIKEFLQAQNRQLKIGVSISTQLRIASIEPGTASYADRLGNLEILDRSRIPSSLVLRPILQQSSDAEYEQILFDARGRTSRVLLGEEYMDSVATAKEYLATQSRPVQWLAGAPRWTFVPCPDRIRILSGCAAQLRYRVFHSDADLMEDLVAERLAHQSATAHDLASGGISV